MVATHTDDGGDGSQELNVDAATVGDSEAGGTTGSGGDASLEEAAEREREYLRGRLRDESGREPTDEELDEWLREHTEGY